MLLVMLFAACVRLLSLSLADPGVGEADATARVLYSLKWIEDPFIFPSTNWPPLQFYIYGLSVILFKDPLYVPLIVNVIFGSLLVLVVGYLTYLLADDGLTGILAGFIVCFYPLAIRFSLIATPEVMLNFWLFLCLYFLVKTVKNDNRKSQHVEVMFATLAMVAAVMTHLQAWYLMPLFSLLLWRKWKYWLVFIGTSLIPMIFFFLHLKGINDSAVPPEWKTYSYDSTDLIMQTLYYPAILIDTLSPALVILSVLGLLHIWDKKNTIWNVKLFPLACFLALIPPYLYFVYSWDRMRPKEALLLCLLLVPYAAFGLRYIASTFNGTVGKWFIILASLSMLLVVPYNWKFIDKGNIFPIPRTTPEFRQIAYWINKNIEPNDRIIFDHLPLWSDYYLAAQSKRFPNDMFLAKDRYSKELLNKLIEFTSQKNPKIMILSKQPTTVSKAIQLKCINNTCPEEIIENNLQANLSKMFETENVVIYRINRVISGKL